MTLENYDLEAEFYSEVTGEYYYTTGPNWSDGIPEEAQDALADAQVFTKLMHYADGTDDDEYNGVVDVVEFIKLNN